MNNEQRPAPLVPPEVDLRGYEFMPFYGHHLFGSDFNARVSDAGWRAAVTLWWAAWNQVPAASLPNNDAALCRLADLGRDLKSFAKIKADALHGFVECADGRLYHKALAKWAIEAWEKRNEHKAGKERLERHRAERRELFEFLRDRGVNLPFETSIATLRETAREHGWNVPGNVSPETLATARQDREVKGEGSDTKNREVRGKEKPTPETAAGDSANGAVSNIANGKPASPGQNWKSPEWVKATSQILGVSRRSGEEYDAWKDRVYEAVRQRRSA